MAKKKLSGPGRLGSTKAVKDTLKKSGNASLKTIPGEDSLTVRFLDEPEDFYGYYEHWLSGGPQPCVTDECEGCDSDDPEEQRKSFRYLANAYVVDDQKVWALKMPKSLVEMLMAFHTKYKGTLLDRDYELSRTGSGKENTKYMAAPEDRQKMNLSRFESKKFDLGKILAEMAGDADEDDEEDDEPVARKKSSKSASPKKSKKPPWEDEDDDEDDEPVVRKKRPVKKSSTNKKRTVGKKTTVRRSK